MKRTILMVCSVMLFLCGIYCNEIYCEETNEMKIEKYTQEIKGNPKKASGYINRAEVYNDLEKYDLALSDIEEALSLDINKKDKEKALDQRIKANINKKFDEHEQSITKKEIFNDINKLFILNPKNPKIYYRKGQYYLYCENKYNISIYFFNKAISLIKNDNKLLGSAIFSRAFGYFSLYEVNKNKMLYDKAIEDYSFIINNLSDDIDSDIIQKCYLFRGLYYHIDDKNKEAAFNDYSNAIKIGKNDEVSCQSYYYRSKIYYDEKKYKNTIEDINNFCELLNKNNKKILNNKEEKKKSVFESEYVESLSFLAESYYQTQDYNATIKTINSYMSKIAYPVRELFTRGASYFNIGEYDFALKDFEALLNFNLDDESKKNVLEKIKQVKQLKKEKQLKKIKTEVFSDENIEF